MLKRTDVLSLGFLKKSPFRGSYRGMRFLMQKYVCEETTYLQVYVWPEPYGFDQTEDEKKTHREFPFTDEGLNRSVDWLNEMHKQFAV